MTNLEHSKERKTTTELSNYAGSVISEVFLFYLVLRLFTFPAIRNCRIESTLLLYLLAKSSVLVLLLIGPCICSNCRLFAAYDVFQV